MTLNPKAGGFSGFFAIFGCNAHFKCKYCAEMAEDRPGQPAYEIFGIERTF